MINTFCKIGALCGVFLAFWLFAGPLADLKVTGDPKIIFKVEDHFKEYFEIFEEQKGGKYQMVYRFDFVS